MSPTPLIWSCFSQMGAATDKSYSFSVTGKPQENKKYKFSCRIGDARKSTSGISACAQIQKTTLPTTQTPGFKEPVFDIDLRNSLSLTPPRKTRKGEIQNIQIQIRNQGGMTNNFAGKQYTLQVLLADNDISKKSQLAGTSKKKKYHAK